MVIVQILLSETSATPALGILPNSGSFQRDQANCLAEMIGSQSVSHSASNRKHGQKPAARSCPPAGDRPLIPRVRQLRGYPSEAGRWVAC
jgi:hypothetical protein